ncbi:MAG: pilus assembly protein PilY [Ramlibacter sp.]|uniref:pilus assembly protein n=1 Tax=Ramlibacter sp. TaxID=1917967 RepID=UPI002629A740|nr:PilC/PilY family type IV pilus protein [Ramlibacter sp.]MDB5753338.1 pilus assembly protein PilY [Ramlibacter sp.]
MKPATPLFRRRLRAVLRTLVTVVAGVSVGHALALNDLSNAPLFTGGSTAVKPNIMFIMDDSGSMQWDFLPDAASVLHRGMYGRWSAHCNGLAYDPDVKYGVPVYIDAGDKVQSKGPAALTHIAPDPANQTTEPNAVYAVSSDINSAGTVDVTLVTGSSGLYFVAPGNPADTVTVYKDAANYLVGQMSGLSINGGRYVLSISVRGRVGTLGGTMTVGKGEPASGVYYKYKGNTARLDWYTSTGAVNSASDFYKHCNGAIDGTYKDKFTAVTVAGSTDDDKQNYANWAKYYRNRVMTMQHSAGLAFKGLDDRYRIGYTTIGQPKAQAGVGDFLHVEDYNDAHRHKFYDQLYAARPGIYGTPLRGALAKAGQYFANKALSQDKDPMQYYCQRNFSILSTDGLWNTGGNRAGESSANQYGAYKLDRTTAVGNQDNDLPRPMADGVSLKVVTTEKWDELRETRIKQTIPLVTVTTRITGRTGSGVTKTEQRTRTEQGSNTGCTDKKRHKRTVIEQQLYTTTATETTTEKTTATATATVVLLRTDGTAQQTVVTVTNGVTNSTVSSSATIAPTDVIESQTVAAGTTVSAIVQPDPEVATSTVLGPVTEVSRSEGTACESVSSTPVTSGWSVTGTGTVTLSPMTPPDPTESIQNKPAVETVVGTPVSKTTDKVITAVYSSTGGAENTLADVAAYYYKTDLRSSGLGNCTGVLGKDVCTNEVPGLALTDPYRSFGDAERQQHMTTFTLGLGVSGSLKYDPKYISQRSGDFHDIVNRSKNWPNVASGDHTTVDDLWHAAVNGRGQYFSAGNPNSLIDGLSSALSAIQAVSGSASAASTSSLQPVAGDNDIYVAQFTTVEWVGDVLAYEINPNTGAITTKPTWSAKVELDKKAPANRKIYYKKKGATETELKEFTYTNLDADNYEGDFDNFCTKPAAGGGLAPAQCAALNSTDMAAANSGANLVEYLRGDQGKGYFRKRSARLGDIINASPLFIGKPSFRYTENGYSTFASANASRRAVVLAAANDGMLHAFARSTDPSGTGAVGGEELWAFIPSFVLPNLYKLADTGYETNHSYFVDGSPQIGDIFVDGAWKTIVVGGLNKGGRGYYALDVTVPQTPKLLWEYKHDDLGYTYGNPIITKRKDGKWVVVFGSGYDNVSPGDGNGHLFVLDANTGALQANIPTELSSGVAAGTASAPSGLARINSWVESELINTSQRFYGGDELGNVWRFDLDNLVEPNGKALLLAQLRGPVGNAVQPITSKPALAAVSYNGATYPVVYVATGTYFRNEDAKDKEVQSIYAIKDPLNATSYGNLRTNTDFEAQTITAGVSGNTPTRTSSARTVNWATKSGWRVDFPVGGERVSVNPQLALDTLYVGANLPKDDDCSVGGESFLYQFDIANGTSTASYVGNVLVQGLTVVQLVTGAAAGSIVTIITRSDGTLQTEVGMPPATGGTLRRTSWRELLD